MMKHIQAGTDLLPKYVPEDWWLEMNDIDGTVNRIYLPKPGILFCDIDGTVADITHRRKFVEGKPKNWPAFEKTMHLDSPVAEIINAVNILYAAEWTVYMVSGRGEQSREVTEKWLHDNGVKYHQLRMRAKGDYRADNIVKQEILNGFREEGVNPTVVFDDRNQVVEMWRENGIPCVQVAPGDF